MISSNPLVFYDISSPIQPRSYAPNPSKTRIALSFKNVHFKTTFVDILDITETRKGLNCPPTRSFDNGTEYYTLPMLQDPASNRVLGDTVDIANYLDAEFPESGGRLFPTQTTATGLDYESPHKDTPFFAPLTVLPDAPNQAYAKFNVHVDATFSGNVTLFTQFLPFNPHSADRVKALMAERAHLPSWDVLAVHGADRVPRLEAFREALESLAAFFHVNDGGPFLEGAQANYADIIVGGWVNMLSVVMPADEWSQFKTWHGGAFGRLHDALQERYFKLA